MAYQQTPAEAIETYNKLVGRYNERMFFLEPERDFFLTVVDQVLRTLRNKGHTNINSVDIGTANGAVAVGTKKLGTGAGVTVGLDICTDLLKIDGKHCVLCAGFETRSGAPPTKRVCLVSADATDRGSYDHLRGLLPAGKTHFDLITAFNFANGIPSNLRPRMWEQWRQLLAPGHGRLVVNISLELPENDGAGRNNILGTVAGACIYDFQGSAGWKTVTCPPPAGQTQDLNLLVPKCMQYTRRAPNSLFARCRQFVAAEAATYGFQVASVVTLGDRDFSGGGFPFVNAVRESTSAVTWTRPGPMPDWFMATHLRDSHQALERVALEAFKQKLSGTAVQAIAVLQL